MEPRFFETAEEWWDWLEKHHHKEGELLVGLHKAKTKKPGLTYAQALDAALCFGWIDGLRKSLGDEAYTIRFTPRRKGSIWSQVNLKRIKELIDEGRMQPAGLRTFEGRDPSKVLKYSSENDPKFDAELLRDFKKHKQAWAYWETCPPSYRKATTWVVISAKQPETRRRRLAKLIDYCERGERMGL
jgi:uncharacterized protein YdeI (YjbR/CyaY-like superfamily)